MRIRLLGDFSVDIGEQTMAGWNTPRLQALLAYLLLHRDAPQSRQHLAFLFWPDSSEEQALANLRNLLFSLRHTLPQIANYLKADRIALRWQWQSYKRGDGDTTSALEIDVDLLQFEQALAEAEEAARGGDTDAQAAALQRAIDVYRGDLLPSSYEDWVLTERERLQQLFTSALESLVTLRAREGNVPAAIEATQRLLRHNPLREAVYKQLMELYAANDMAAEALHIYHTCSTTLQRELGIEPSANTRKIYERLLDSRRSTLIPRPSVASTGPAVIASGFLTPQLSTLKAVSPLTGRSAEWALLEQAWWQTEQRRGDAEGDADRVGRRGPRVVLIRGEAGIGKTRLAEELLNSVERQNVATATTASARCYPVETRLAFGPVVDWLRCLPIPPLAPVWMSEVARLRPEILAAFPNTPPPGPLAEAWQRRRLMEALARALLSNQPLLLTLDDLQWCDSDTLELLHFLLRFDPEARLLLVMTARTEELDASSDPARTRLVTGLLDNLRDADQLSEIDLPPLDREQSAKLAATLAGGQELELPHAVELFNETEGNPLFIIEMLRTGWHQGGTQQPASASTAPGPKFEVPFGSFRLPTIAHLPPRIARVLRARLDQLSPAARSLVDFAAVIGRDFTLPLLQLASAEDEKMVVAAVDELWRRRIVREQGADGYDFSHDKLREVAYGDLSLARRRLLHRRVAETLREAYAARPDEVSGQIAAHYQLAGLPMEAIPFYRMSARSAARIYANEEAIAHYRRALDLINPKSGEAPEIYEALADILHLTGRYDDAREALENAQGLMQVPQDQDSRMVRTVRARLHRKIGNTFRAQGKYPEALQVYAAAEEALGLAYPFDNGFEGIQGVAALEQAFDPERSEWGSEGLRRSSSPGADSQDAEVDREAEVWRAWCDIQFERGALYYGAGDADNLERSLKAVQLVIKRFGTAGHRADLFRELSQLHFRRNRYVVSLEDVANERASLAAARDTGDMSIIAGANFRLGFRTLWYGDLDAAEEHLRVSLQMANQVGDQEQQMLSYTYLSILSRERRLQDEARRYAEHALEVATSRDAHSYMGAAKANLCWLALQESDARAAQQLGDDALCLWADTKYPFQWLALFPLARIALTRGHLDEAVNYLRRLLSQVQQRPPSDLEDAVVACVSAWDDNRPDEAGELAGKAVDLGRDLGYL